MRRFSITIWAMILFLGLLSACSQINIPNLTIDQTPPPFPVTDPTLMPSTRVTFTAMAPANTPQDALLELVILDEVTGVPYNQRSFPMTRQNDGRYVVEVNPPAGTLLRYRYIRTSPGQVGEAGADGLPIRYRVAFLPGSMNFDDLIAAWTDAPYQGETGQITGRLVDASTLLPLPETILTIAGQIRITDAFGDFRVDQLIPGLHQLVAFRFDGSYQPAQQGAVIDGGETTPAQLPLFPAQKIQVTFEVTVPEDTIEGTPLRIAGNLKQFGHIFGELAGGITNQVSAMPTLVEVDPTHYIQIFELYAGTDLRYKYTRGDGLWNTEHNSQGALKTRQVILPDTDLIIRDEVESWHPRGQGSVFFSVTLPADTPEGDQISLQLNPSIWVPPLPMWQIGPLEWFYVLHGPLNTADAIGYRYCRNLQCNLAVNAQYTDSTQMGQALVAEKFDQERKDVIQAWEGWDQSAPELTVIAPPISPRAEMELGMELSPSYNPGWDPFIGAGLEGIASLGSQNVILTPGWTIERVNPTPLIGFNPAQSPDRNELSQMISISREQGLGVALHPTMLVPGGEVDQFWFNATRDEAWWASWFEGYRSFILSAARTAAQNNVEKLIIGGPEIRAALPGEFLADGSASGLPADAAERWRSLILEIRNNFSGILAFEVEHGNSLQNLPEFIQEFDSIHVYWHAPLSISNQVDFAELQAEASSQLSDVLATITSASAVPVHISVEYLAVDGAATACPVENNGVCLDSAVFDRNVYSGNDIQLDMGEQSEAINAVLLEAYNHPEIEGFYVRRYNPVVATKDFSASINGKPARDLIWYWYTNIQNP
jgi:hypothetical protein